MENSESVKPKATISHSELSFNAQDDFKQYKIRKGKKLLRLHTQFDPRIITDAEIQGIGDRLATTVYELVTFFNPKGSLFNPVFIRAIKNNDVSLVKLMLNHHADPNQSIPIIPKYANSPLSLAIDQKASDEMIQALLSHGANPNWISSEPLYTPILWSAIKTRRFSLVKLLIEFGADPNLKDPIFQKNSLNEAIGSDQPNIVELLLQHGAKPNSDNDYQTAPLIQAIHTESLATVTHLLHYGANPNAPKDSYLQSQCPLHEALKQKQHHIILLLLQYKADANAPYSISNNNTSFTTAILNHDITAIKIFLQHGIQPRFEDLYKAFQEKSMPLLKIFQSKKLFDTCFDHEGNTIYHYAIEKHDYSILKTLILLGTWETAPQIKNFAHKMPLDLLIEPLHVQVTHLFQVLDMAKQDYKLPSRKHALVYLSLPVTARQFFRPQIDITTLSGPLPVEIKLLILDDILGYSNDLYKKISQDTPLAAAQSSNLPRLLRNCK